MPVNARSAEPRSPSPWINAERCSECGQLYKQFNSGVTFQDGIDDFKSLNADEGYMSRGPVLWLMRCRKLTIWYYSHAGCGVPF